LLTDGEDLEKSGVAMAKALADKGIVVHAIGVGTAAGSPIRILSERGTVDYVRDHDGSVVVSHLDATTLSAIAQATHGTYEPLGAVGEGLTHVRHLVENSTNAADFSKTRKLGVDRFYIPVGLLIILLVVESLIGTRRASRQNAD
jgi:Ca-activated chloride channel homolog